MKQNSDFLLRNVADSDVLVPVGAAASFGGMISLNAVGCYIWELLETEQTAESLAEALVQRYEVTYEKALEDVQRFVGLLESAGAVVE